MATDLGLCPEPRSVPSLGSGFGWLTGRQVEVEREQLGEGTLGTPRRVFRTRILSLSLSPSLPLIYVFAILSQFLRQLRRQTKIVEK